MRIAISGRGAHDERMQTRERSFERGQIPVAAFFVVILLGAGALAFDSAKVAMNREAQLAAANTTDVPKTSTPAPARAEKCVNNNHLTVTVGTSADAEPIIVERLPLNPVPASGNTKGCYVKFCVGRTPNADSGARETCTDERYYADGDKLQTDAGNNRLAANGFASTVLNGLEPGRTVDLTGLTSGMEANTSGLILGAFESQQELAVVATNGQYNEALQTLQACTADCGSLQTAADDARIRFEAEQARLFNLQEQAQSLAATQGQLQGSGGTSPPTNDGGFSSYCLSGQTWNGTSCVTSSDNTFNRGQQPLDAATRVQLERRCQQNPNDYEACMRLAGGGQPPPGGNPPPPPPSCSTWQRLVGGCGGTGGDPYGSGSYCVTSTYPSVTIQGPWRPGCLNNPNNPYGQQQQCSAMQQIISGCPNPFNPYQQQCGGLMALLNKCPAGSYNPNNPSNPYNYPTPTCSLQASPTNVSAAGQAAVLSWQSQNASYAYLSNSGQIGPNGSMQVYPQTPTTYTMTVVGYGNQQGRCETRVSVGGQGGGSGPTAQISCQPQIADVGMDVSISFACQNAAASVGSGFSTGGKMADSVIATVPAPTLGMSTATYGLTCSNHGVTHSAQCTVNINKSAIVLVANPKTVQSSGEANIGWVTSGMDACVISSTNAAFTAANASSTNVSGATKTGALTETASFVLTCETKAGATKTASTTVTVQ